MTSRPGKEDCNCRLEYDGGNISMFAAVAAEMGGCMIVEVVVRPELLDIGGVGIVVDVLMEER